MTNLVNTGRKIRTVRTIMREAEYLINSRGSYKINKGMERPKTLPLTLNYSQFLDTYISF